MRGECRGMHRLSRLRAPASIAVAGLAVALLSAQPALAANATSTNTLIVERPTLISAGYEWRITGDDNRNAKVDVTYRKKGETAWHSAIAPMRQNGEVTRGGGAQPQPGEPPVRVDPKTDPATLSVTYIS